MNISQFTTDVRGLRVSDKLRLAAMLHEAGSRHVALLVATRAYVEMRTQSASS